MRKPAQFSLHTRISVVLTLLAASLLLVLSSLWLHGTRASIREEVEAATRVAEQWLSALSSELGSQPAANRVIGAVRPLGRIRANALAVVAADNAVLYRSPEPTYKLGRAAPAWFATVLDPAFEPRTLIVGELRIVLYPDASRALIDAWDNLVEMAGWALLLLVLMFVAIHRALGRALRPLDLVMRALDRTGHGRFDTRLPVFATPELDRLSRAFNGMADRLAAAVDDNVRLETERELALRMQSRLEEERRDIARELHDELAQGITAVRALAGAIVQRTPEQPALYAPAQSIVAVTGEMQDGVRAILHRLRPVAGPGLATALERLLAGWRMQHPAIALQVEIDLSQPVGNASAQAIIRIVQEGLTNVVRHAEASRVELRVSQQPGWIEVTLTDNGRGLHGGPSAQPGSGLGLAGMDERIAALGGQLVLDNAPGGGLHLRARLPEKSTSEES
jgi:two-component system sensor histidine kinase UhpB